MSVTCGKLACGDKMTMEEILLSLFAKNLDGCIGLKLMALPETVCTDLGSVAECADILTVEQALAAAIVDDGCDGYALGVYLLTDE